jgi:MoxR-like ATPase
MKPADLKTVYENLRSEANKVLVGLDEPFELLIIALLTGGHVLLEGVPGTAKTLMAKSLALMVKAQFTRIQFTPDLMPSDILGTSVYDMATGHFNLKKGPIFTQLLLADEINRAPAKTQSALLEAMEERQVNLDGERHALEAPFMVIATQNPIEYEGTYPLPEAQLDRFMFKLLMGYPTFEQEATVLTRHHQGLDPHDVVAAGVRPVASAADLARARAEVGAIGVEPAVIGYITALCRATRETPSVQLGVSPRGAAALLHASKAWAWMSGRTFVSPDEVKAVAKPAMRHRMMIRPELELEGATADGILDAIMSSVPTPR